jgi:O-glycosyl hydrolase
MKLFCKKPFRTAIAGLAVCSLFGANSLRARAQDGGHYRIRMDQPQQVIKGLGFEIQSDSIGSLNLGMPEEVIAVPHDLTPSEKTRLYKEMLHGFRYTRLAMGLYLRGLDADQKHIVERYPGQLNDLRTMQKVAGIEGFDVEYWSPPPFWKDSKSYYGGTLAGHDPAFFNAFSDALVQDVKYLESNGLHVAQWGLQNEPVFGVTPLNGEKPKAGERPKMPYGIMFYSPDDYATTLKYTVPKLRAFKPSLHIHANSWDGPAGKYAEEIRKDSELLKNIDAWT